MRTADIALARLLAVEGGAPKTEVYPYESDIHLVKVGHAEQAYYMDLESCAWAYGESRDQVVNLSMLVKRLMRAVPDTATINVGVKEQAANYLKAHGLEGSILR